MCLACLSIMHWLVVVLAVWFCDVLAECSVAADARSQRPQEIAVARTLGLEYPNLLRTVAPTLIPVRIRKQDDRQFLAMGAIADHVVLSETTNSWRRRHPWVDFVVLVTKLGQFPPWDSQTYQFVRLENHRECSCIIATPQATDDTRAVPSTRDGMDDAVEGWGNIHEKNEMQLTFTVETRCCYQIPQHCAHSTNTASLAVQYKIGSVLFALVESEVKTTEELGLKQVRRRQGLTERKSVSPNTIGRKVELVVQTRLTL
ncbi:hypothetical protein L210DRAFT_3505046 [Boletus edulis BED1]|uniref:RxLR effector candidate protein n=1 Tax=Boletus edulis BED1 TaxID=1328754 RepID=A0AAD4BRB8_BOLED|nr:hypothetical protein L210DRAFT_3505046 [Boletus edulis BED1]